MDRVADWIVHELDARAQLRFGVLITVGSVIWSLAAFLFTSEPPNVILMSGVALVLTGIGIVLSGEILEIQEQERQELKERDE